MSDVEHRRALLFQMLNSNIVVLNALGMIEDFENAVRAEAREECAVLVERACDSQHNATIRAQIHEIAAAIRSAKP